MLPEEGELLEALGGVTKEFGLLGDHSNVVGSSILNCEGKEAVEFPRSEVRSRAEIRSSEVARKSKGLSRPCPTPSPSPPRFLFKLCCCRFLLDQTQPTRFLQ